MGLYQDNISSHQLLINNGKLSSSKKTKHIKSKFFFIKDRVDSREVRVIDCPAEEMWVNILTKPLQGMAFRKMQANKLMNCPVKYKENNKLTEKPAIHLWPMAETRNRDEDSQQAIGIHISTFLL